MARPAADVNAACVGCFICGDLEDHGGRPHGEVTGDGKRRRDGGPARPIPMPKVTGYGWGVED